MKKYKIILLFFLIVTILTGIIYPVIVTIFAATFYPHQANGSLIYDKKGSVIGSELIAQKFVNPKYFWARPSYVDYNTMPSGGSNIAISSIEFKKQILKRKKENLNNEMLTFSGSGLDPEISIKSALDQIDRIILARHWNKSIKIKIVKIINKNKIERDLKILGEPRINVLKLNLELDKLHY